MKQSKIMTLGIIIAIIVSISVLAINSNFQNITQPAIIDGPVHTDDANMNLDPISDSPALNDSSTSQKIDFWIDEDGKKHYTIKAKDSPTMED